MGSAGIELVTFSLLVVSIFSSPVQQNKLVNQGHQLDPFRNDYNLLVQQTVEQDEPDLAYGLNQEVDGPTQQSQLVNQGRQLVPYRNDYNRLVKQTIVQDGPFWDGSYYFRYVNADGTIREEGGRPGWDGQLIVMGSYQYPADYTTNGQIITIEYIADSNGYRAHPQGTNPEYVSPQRILDPGLPPNRGQVDNYSSGFIGSHNNFNQGRADRFNRGRPDRLSRAISQDIARQRRISYCNYINPRKVPAVWYWNYC